MKVSQEFLGVSLGASGAKQGILCLKVKLFCVWLPLCWFRWKLLLLKIALQAPVAVVIFRMYMHVLMGGCRWAQKYICTNMENALTL